MTRQSDGKALKIGTIFMFSGGVGQLGEDSFNGANAALHLVNARGGVNGRRLEWVKADGFSPKEAASQAERMIREDGVRCIIGCYGSNHSIEVSKVCERLGVVLWVQTAWTATLFDHKPKYTFRTNNYATPVEVAAVEFVVANAAGRLGKAPHALRVAVINEASAYGVSCAEETIKALAARKIEPVFRMTYDTQYDGSNVVFSDVVGEVRRAGPDVLFASSFIHDAIGLLMEMKRIRYRPPVIMTSSAGFGLYTLNLAGDMTEGVLSSNAPALISTAALNESGRDLQHEYVTRLKGLHGTDPSGFNAMAFCAGYSLFHDVLPKLSDNFTADDVRKAAMALDIPLGTYPNGWGLKFDERGQNLRCPPSVDQWQDGELRTIWPPEWATSGLRNIPLSVPV
jgi:branched-chain amino acid transport system substrate-binding protein